MPHLKSTIKYSSRDTALNHEISSEGQTAEYQRKKSQLGNQGLTGFKEYLPPITLQFYPSCLLLKRNKAGNIYTNVTFRGVSVTTVAEQKQEIL
jgi:hypothetical protein